MQDIKDRAEVEAMRESLVRDRDKYLRLANEADTDNKERIFRDSALALLHKIEALNWVLKNSPTI